MTAINRYEIQIKTILLSVVISFLLLLFFSDGLSKYFTVIGDDFTRISLIARLLFETFIIGYLLYYLNRVTLNYMAILGILFLFFINGQLLIGNLNNLYETFITYNKYIYLFLVYLFFKAFLNKENSKKVYNIMTSIFILNILAIFLGFIFELPYFESFHNMDHRPGYNGVFIAGNESSFVLICMISFFYFRVFYENNSKLLLFIAIIASLLSGMKAVYIFLVLLGLFHFFNRAKLKNILFLSPLFLIALYFIVNYLQSEHFYNLIEFFMVTLEEKGFFYMIISGRNTIVANEGAMILENWTFLNYLIGGQNIVQFIMEMDFFDLFFFFGLLGMILYLGLFYQSFMKGLMQYKFFIFFFFTLLTLAFFGGHFFKSPTTALYFTLVVLYFQNSRIKPI